MWASARASASASVNAGLLVIWLLPLDAYAFSGVSSSLALARISRLIFIIIYPATTPTVMHAGRGGGTATPVPPPRFFILLAP